MYSIYINYRFSLPILIVFNFKSPTASQYSNILIVPLFSHYTRPLVIIMVFNKLVLLQVVILPWIQFKFIRLFFYKKLFFVFFAYFFILLYLVLFVWCNIYLTTMIDTENMNVYFTNNSVYKQHNIRKIKQIKFFLTSYNAIWICWYLWLWWWCVKKSSDFMIFLGFFAASQNRLAYNHRKKSG